MKKSDKIRAEIARLDAQLEELRPVEAEQERRALFRKAIKFGKSLPYLSDAITHAAVNFANEGPWCAENRGISNREWVSRRAEYLHNRPELIEQFEYPSYRNEPAIY